MVTSASIAGSNSNSTNLDEWGEGKLRFEDVQLEAKKAEIKQFLECAVVSKTLHKMLEVFSAPPVVPEHNLKDWCKSCKKCTTYFITGGQTFIETKQIAAFNAHIWRITTKEEDATFRFRIKYMLDQSALHLPDNYQISFMRAALSKLEPEAQREFTARLSKGLRLRYWGKYRAPLRIVLCKTPVVFIPIKMVVCQIKLQYFSPPPALPQPPGRPSGRKGRLPAQWIDGWKRRAGRLKMQVRGRTAWISCFKMAPAPLARGLTMRQVLPAAAGL